MPTIANAKLDDIIVLIGPSGEIKRVYRRVDCAVEKEMLHVHGAVL